MKPKIYKCYKGIVKYHRIDDLQEGSPKNGSIVHLDAMWIADSDERFAGDVILRPAESCYWLPERDVDITEEISRAEYDLACSQMSRVHY